MGFGGIGSGIANASDVAFNNPANLQVLTYNSTSSKWTNAAVPGGSGGPFGTYYLDARTYGVVADGTTDNRTSMTAAIAAATSLAQNGNDVVLQFPAGVIYTSTAMSSAYTDPNGTWMSAALGYGLPVNISGSITIQGVGINATIFKLSNNCRNLFWINQVAFNDVYQNITLQDFQVDFNGLTSSTRGHGIVGNRPYNNQFQRFLNFSNLVHNRLRLKNVPEDPAMTNTSIIGVLYLGQQSSDWAAGVTPGSLPLKPFAKDTAAADGWTYSLDIVFEDVEILDARGALQVAVLVNTFTTHYVDRIRMTRCRHYKEQLTEATSTAFYVTGLGGFDGIIFEGCSSTNVGDDAIEIGGGQRYIIRDFLAVNSHLEGIYMRTWLMPLDPDNTYLEIENYVHRITADAPAGAWPSSSTGNRNVRSVPLQVDFTIKAADDDASNLGTQLAMLKVTNMTTVIEGGLSSRIIRGSSTNKRVGFHFDGHVKNSSFTDCKAIFRNVNLDSSSGTTVATMLSMRPVTFETGVVPVANVRNFEAIFENCTSNGAQFEVRGIETGGNGDIFIDGFNLAVKGMSNASIIRTGLVYPGWVTGSSVRNLVLKRIRGEVIGTFPTVRRGITLMDDSTVSSIYFDECDLSVFGVTADVTYTAGNGKQTVIGNTNTYANTVNGGVRVPVAGNYVMRAHEKLIAVTSTSSAVAITLPAIATVPLGQRFKVIDESNAAGTNSITITPAGGDTFIGGAVMISANGGSVEFYSNGTNWISIK